MEYNLLEEQLQKTLADLEKREKTLAHAEMEVSCQCIAIITVHSNTWVGQSLNKHWSIKMN